MSTAAASPSGGANARGDFAPRIVVLADVASQPWRNGAGRTRELLAWPDAATWQIRVSVAEIDRAAPFSSFPGVERWFAVIDGAGVELGIEGTTLRVVPGAPPLRFAGEAKVDGGPIAGPTRDLNLMLRGARGAMHVAADGVAWHPGAAACGLFAAVKGRWSRLDAASGVEASGEVPALSLVWFDPAPTGLRFDATARPDVSTQTRVGWWLAATPSKEGDR